MCKYISFSPLSSSIPLYLYSSSSTITPSVTPAPPPFLISIHPIFVFTSYLINNSLIYYDTSNIPPKCLWIVFQTKKRKTPPATLLTLKLLKSNITLIHPPSGAHQHSHSVMRRFNTFSRISPKSPASNLWQGPQGEKKKRKQKNKPQHFSSPHPSPLPPSTKYSSPPLIFPIFCPDSVFFLGYLTIFHFLLFRYSFNCPNPLFNLLRCVEKQSLSSFIHSQRGWICHGILYSCFSQFLFNLIKGFRCFCSSREKSGNIDTLLFS